MIRKTIMLNENLNMLINIIRGKLLKIDIDLEYTTLVDMLIECGAVQLSKQGCNEDPEILDILKKHMGNIDMRVEVFADVLWSATVTSLDDPVYKRSLQEQQPEAETGKTEK